MANIFAQYTKPPRSIAEYTDDLNKVESGGIDTAIKRRDFAENNALRAALAGGVDPMSNDLMRVAPTQALAIRKSSIENLLNQARIGETLAQTRERVSNTGKHDAETQEKHIGMLKYFAGGVLADPTPENALRALDAWESYTRQKLPESERAKVVGLQTSDQVRQWAASHSMAADKLLPQRGTPMNTGTNITTPVFDPVTQRMIQGAGVTMPVQVSPNTTANINALAQLRSAQTDAANAIAAGNAPAGTQVPLGGGITAPAPQGFPRINPATQSNRNAEQVAILTQELQREPDPQNRAAIQAEITKLSGTPFAAAGGNPQPPAPPQRAGEFVQPPRRVGETNNQYQQRVRELEAIHARARIAADNRPLSVTAQKAIEAADQSVMSNTQVLDYIKQAQSLNDKAMGFPGAGAAAVAGSLLPQAVRPDTVDSTITLDNIIQNSVLPNLKATFGGNPTEGERKILLEVAGSSGKNPSVRKGIFARAEKAAADRLKFNQDKAKNMRDGTYFKPGGAPDTGASGSWKDL